MPAPNIRPASYFRDGRVLVDACVKGTMDGYMREWPEELVFDEVP